MTRRRLVCCGSLLALACLILPRHANAMHLAEGILPLGWAAFWWLLAGVGIALGLRELRVRAASNPSIKPLLALVGSGVFVVSCMPIPVPVAGSTAHPCATGLAAMLLGPRLSVVVASVALVLQLLFLGHGGLTTLGANIASMGIAGAYAGFFVFALARRCRAPWWVAAFAAGLVSDWATYATTSFELAAALHGSGRMLDTFVGLVLAFAPTQVPLGVLEGVISATAYRFVQSRRPDLLELLPAGERT